jgi:hypothetical protein
MATTSRYDKGETHFDVRVTLLENLFEMGE